jgi:hypothetical protein
MNAEVVRIMRGRSCWKINVRCPFCKSLHQHGGGDTDIMLGSRVSHCGRGEYNIVISQDNALSSQKSSPEGPLLGGGPRRKTFQ